ncbi:hypothetical protein GCM10023065_30970 [Microbacterium laevaniformans]|uniref:threonine synthase n=1 Tax=Microbacterium laevaniformans TaxID=36807 RepID=UPI0031F0736C
MAWRPRCRGCSASRPKARRLSCGEVVRNPRRSPRPSASATPASWELALEARDATQGWFGAIDDARILAAQKLLASTAGVFVEPASAIGVAGLLDRAAASIIPAGATVVITVTGHGLKDPQWALRNADGTEVEPTVVDATTSEVASVSTWHDHPRFRGTLRRGPCTRHECQPRSRVRYSGPRSELV